MRRIRSTLLSVLAATVLVACADGLTSPATNDTPRFEETCDSIDSETSECFSGTQGSNG